MFTTHDTAEMTFITLFGEGFRHWRLIERHGYSPWFHVSITLILNGMKTHRVVMPSTVAMLENLLTQQGAELIVKDVQVVMPGWMTGRNGWSMERLVELKTQLCVDGDYIQTYTVEGGKAYREGGDEDSVIDTSQSEVVVYRCP